MQLITETYEQVQLITEGKDGAKSYYIEGIFVQADKQNKNGRNYPLDNISEEMNRYVAESINTSRAMGELGHPDSPKINLERVSHIIQKLTQEGSNYIGRAKILDTPYGKIAKNFIDEGVKLAVSSRGMGTLKSQNGIPTIQSDYKLAAVDIVADPSAPDAFVSGIMEGKEWVWNNGIIQEKDIAEYKNVITRTKMTDLERVKVAIFENFCSKL